MEGISDSKYEVIIFRPKKIITLRSSFFKIGLDVSFKRVFEVRTVYRDMIITIAYIALKF